MRKRRDIPAVGNNSNGPVGGYVVDHNENAGIDGVGFESRYCHILDNLSYSTICSQNTSRQRLIGQVRQVNDEETTSCVSVVNSPEKEAVQ